MGEHVRPIGEVIADLRRILVKHLNGAKTHPGHMAAWSTVNECAKIIAMAEMSDDETDARYRAVKAGERYAAGTVVRKVADAYGVSNFRKGRMAR